MCIEMLFILLTLYALRIAIKSEPEPLAQYNLLMKELTSLQRLEFSNLNIERTLRPAALYKKKTN